MVLQFKFDIWLFRRRPGRNFFPCFPFVPNQMTTSLHTCDQYPPQWTLLSTMFSFSSCVWYPLELQMGLWRPHRLLGSVYGFSLSVGGTLTSPSSSEHPYVIIIQTSQVSNHHQKGGFIGSAQYFQHQKNEAHSHLGPLTPRLLLSLLFLLKILRMIEEEKSSIENDFW